MIDVSGWGEFRIEDIFDVVKGTRLTKADMKDGTIKFVGSSAMNNGETHRIANNEKLHPANTITVCYNGSVGETFYQDETFWASDDVNVLYPKFNMTKNTAMFVCPIIRSVGKKYAFIDKWKQEDMKNAVIKLPINMEGDPDWDYMESYMKAVMEESEKSLENLRKADDTKHLIDVSGWGEFRVGDLFDKLTLKCRKSGFNKAVDCSEIQTEEFSLPLTNAKHFNNGIQFYGRPDEWDSAEMTIDIVSNGAIATGDVYAQPQKTGVLWDSYLIKCKYDIESEFVLQYMACVIQRCIKQYFGWDDKCTWDKVKEQTLQLPIDVNGEPDWQYMEDYMEKRLNEAELAVSQLQLAV